MKKAVIVSMLVCWVCLCFAPFAYAQAVDTPYVVISGEVWLLERESGYRLFQLPQSYYAIIDNLDESFYYVTFNGVSGKVERGLVSSVGYHTTAEGTVQELRVDPAYNAFTEIKLKSSLDGGGTDIPMPVTESFIFIGKYPMSEMWYYIKYNEQYGYIRASFTTKPEIAIPTFLPEEKPAVNIQDPPKSEETKPENNLTKILVISGLSVVGVVLVILIFKPTKGKRNRYYYEE